MEKRVELINFFLSLPNEVERAYELSITQYVTEIESPTLRKDLNDILASDSYNNEVRYAAFYSLSILYRRNKDISLLENLINSYESQFKEHPTFSHLYVLYMKEKGVGRDVIKLISKAYDAYQKMSLNAGVVHNFAETVTSCYENSDNTTKDLIKKDWLFKANEAIDNAIELDRTYAKYYCTKGRLLAIDNLFSEAKASINRAIDIESSEKSDYVIRLGNYQYYLLRVQSEEYKCQIDALVSENEKIIQTTKRELDDKFKEHNIKNLEFLGFFSAIVSFTIGSIQIINNQSFENAQSLIIVLFSALLSLFGAFGLILHGFNKRTLPNILAFVIGITFIIIINRVW